MKPLPYFLASFGVYLTNLALGFSDIKSRDLSIALWLFVGFFFLWAGILSIRWIIPKLSLNRNSFDLGNYTWDARNQYYLDKSNIPICSVCLVEHHLPLPLVEEYHLEAGMNYGNVMMCKRCKNWCQSIDLVRGNTIEDAARRQSHPERAIGSGPEYNPFEN